ncbi:MAG: BREX-1 system adenine-specific DNA-methyltransferase PglX, partial [Deferrisomatales bacterium]
MNTAQLSKYAPTARRAFIAAVSAQAARLGITAKGSAPAEVQGDVLLVGGQAFPRAFAEPRKKLAERVKAHGFDQTMEAIAYTWFNRFVAIRYMELHGYLDHGYRVLSGQGTGDRRQGLGVRGQGVGGRPEILDHAADVDLPGLDRAKVVELKLDGTRDEELYRLLLKAQCNALHQAMPFLFEKIGDETELLLPANLLHTDSLIRQLVEQVDEALWQEIEIIGWLYQFYISEKKDQVIGKVVKSEDIPAATQLFTPNWIVKYMVQNSLGAQWLATYPQSPLKGQMAYY